MAQVYKSPLELAKAMKSKYKIQKNELGDFGVTNGEEEPVYFGNEQDAKDYLLVANGEKLGPDSSNGALGFDIAKKYGFNQNTSFTNPKAKRFIEEIFDLYGGNDKDADEWLKRNYPIIR